MQPVYLQASFGGVDLDLASISTDGGRSLVIHESARGDVPTVQDRGRAVNRTDCSVLFVERTSVDDPLQRFFRFKDLVDAGKPQILRHPIEGSYTARVDGMSYSIDAEANEVSVSCQFVATSEVLAVGRPGAGTTRVAGAQDVDAAAAECDTTMDDAGLESDVPTTTGEKVRLWVEDERAGARRVLLDASSMAEQIDAEIEALELATDIRRYPVYRAFIMLRASMRSAAVAATASTADTFRLTVRVASSLRSVLSRVYGAREVEERMRQALEINDVANPGAVPPGTVLTLVATGARR